MLLTEWVLNWRNERSYNKALLIHVKKRRSGWLSLWIKPYGKMFLCCSYLKKTNPIETVSIVTVTFGVFLSFPKLPPFLETNEYHRKSTPYHYCG
jgi:hypothetical protein